MSKNKHVVADFLQYNRDPYWETFAAANRLKPSRKIRSVQLNVRRQWQKLRDDALVHKGLWAEKGLVVPPGPAVSDESPGKDEASDGDPDSVPDLQVQQAAAAPATHGQSDSPIVDPPPPPMVTAEIDLPPDLPPAITDAAGSPAQKNTGDA